MLSSPGPRGAASPYPFCRGRHSLRIRKLNDIIQSMNSSASGFLPLFRSPQQLKVLAYLLINAGQSFPVPELVRLTGVSQPTVWRELARLEKAELVKLSTAGRTRIVEVNQQSPYFSELRSLMFKIAGPAISLKDALARVPGVKGAYIFGSWARRYAGEVGPPPRDIDVVVIGEADPDAVEAACQATHQPSETEINAVVVSRDDWLAARSGFVRQLKKGPLVPILENAQ